MCNCNKHTKTETCNTCENNKKPYPSKMLLWFSTKDPKFTSENLIVNPSTTNYISHTFVNCPIYNSKGSKIGYKVSDDYVQQVSFSPNKYIVRLNNTYSFTSNGKNVGTISWQYVFENEKNDIFYPVNVPAQSTIISGTGTFKNATGNITLIPTKDGKRSVTILFT